MSSSSSTASGAPRSPVDGHVIYRGLRTSVKLALHAGERANVALYAYDRAGHVSAPARRVVSLAALLPLRPITGSTVSGRLRLSWKPRAGAAYYNVQVFHKGTRVRVRLAATRLAAAAQEGASLGDVRLVRVARVQGPARRREILRADRARDVRLQT